ncbi:hypothetical protein HZA96_05535 [Candidatus Woesearchaeota archaeon]|nr:hypothetical protein [Candidatus Woesearchaeota archaeon]
MVSSKNKLALLISIIFLFAMAYSVAAVPNWGQVSYMFPPMPFAQNGPGLRGDSCTMGIDTYYQGGVSAVCGLNSSWDLGGVFLFFDPNTVYWKVTGINFSQAKFCGGTKNVSLAVIVNSDGQTGTGGWFLGYPEGDDYVFYINGTTASVRNTTAYFFYTNATLASNNGSAYRINNSAVVEINTTECNGTPAGLGPGGFFMPAKPGTVYFAVNRSYLQRPISFNQTTFVASSNNPVFTSPDSISVELDGLGVDSGEDMFQDFMNFNRSDFGAEFKMGCAQYRATNATVCQNNSNGDQCTWDSSFNDCFPKSFFGGDSGFTCSDMCGECSTSGTCAGNTKCIWDQYMFNFKTHTQGACREDSSKFIFKPGKNCDTSCNDCSTQYACNASKYPDPTGQGGKGCLWVNDSFSNSWCTLSTFNTQTLTCNPQNFERCWTQTECETKGGTWNSNYFFCSQNSTGLTEVVCFDGIDNDNDNMTDCSDSECKTKKECGGDLDILTGGFNTTDQTMAMGQKYMKEFNPEVKAEMLGNDATDAGLINNNSHLDIMGLMINEAGPSYMMGMGVKNVSPLALCGNSPGTANKSATYVFLLDTDKNSSTGCGINVSNSNQTGYEYKIELFYNYTGTNFTEAKKGYICVKTSGSMALTPIKMISQPTAGNGLAMGCMMGGIGIGIVREDIGSPNSMRLAGATFDTTTNLSYPNDTIMNVYYESGQMDFHPVDCFSNPTACGSAFSSTGKGKFMPFQDCFSDQDTDGNGVAGCADPMCGGFPRCQSVSNRYNASADTTAPTVISTSSYGFKSFIDVKVVTNEPSNLSVTLYNQSSTCAESAKNATLTEPTMFIGDRFRSFHGMPISNTSVGINILQPGQTQFYKTKTCDPNGNCAVSSCLNYSVKATTANENVSFKFEFSPPAGNSMLGNLSIKFRNGTADISIPNGSTKNIAQYLQNATLVIENQNQSGTPYTIELVGVDLTKTINTNLTSGINATNFSSNGTYIGFDSASWQEMAQNLGIDSIKLNISIPNSTANTSSIYTSLFKCASDNITSCTNVTGNATKLGGGNTSVDWVQWEVPTSLGFSVYGYSGAGNIGTSTSSSSSSGGGGSSSTVVAPVVAPVAPVVPAPVATPAPAAPVAEAKSGSEVPAVASPTIEKSGTTEVTNVRADGSTNKEQVKKTAKSRRDLAGKAFDQLFGSAGSGMGALIVLVLIVVIVVGIMYYKKTHKE